MWKQGEQVEGQQDARQRFLAMSKIVLEIVAVRLQHIEGLVLDLPPRARRRPFGDAVGGNRQIGDEAVVIGALPAALRISMENQLTSMASSVPRNGTAFSQR